MVQTHTRHTREVILTSLGLSGLFQAHKVSLTYLAYDLCSGLTGLLQAPGTGCPGTGCPSRLHVPVLSDWRAISSVAFGLPLAAASPAS